MSTYLCEKPVPHEHRWPLRRPSDGQKPLIGDVAQCECGKYAVYKWGDYAGWWSTRPAWWARHLIRRCES